MTLIAYLFTSLAFAFLWWTFRRINIWLKARGHFRNKNLMPLLTLSLLISWLYFSSWYFLGDSDVYNNATLFLSLVIVLPIALYFTKDIIAGVIFQINGVVSKGAQLTTENGTAQVIKVGYNGVLISNERNEIRKVLYSDLKIIESTVQEGAFQDENLFSMDLTLNETNEKEIIKGLNQLIFNCPWVKVGVLPTTTIKIKKGKSEVKVTLELISNAYQERFKDYLMEGFN